jgi:two-component sensor histidine kinase
MPSTASPPQTQLRLRALAAALEGRGICILHQTPDHRFDLVEHLPPMWSSSSVLHKVETDFMGEPLASQFTEAVAECLRSKHPASMEFELAEPARTTYYQAKIVPDEDGVLTILTDVTEERSRNAAIASLLREVSHRSKNLLAIVQSVAMQTAHHTDDVQGFLNKFRGRLHALSSTQDLVTESDWKGTFLQPLISSQLARVGQAASKHVQVTGENPLLGPNASLHLGLAIHELAVNAVSHGGLAEGKGGGVWVSAAFDEADTGNHLILEWLENRTGPALISRTPRFGTLVLERIVPLSVGGTATFSIANDQVHYRLAIPSQYYEA